MPTVATSVGELHVETAYPGGNAWVRGVDGDTLLLSPELRDSVRRPLYWNVELSSPVAQDLTVSFDEGLVSPRGPAVSQEAEPWDWLGADARIDELSFEYSLSPGETVRFAFAPPYQVADFDAFLGTTKGDFTSDPLTTSEDGRAVPLVRWNGSAQRHVVLTCRHHACESTASYVFEGFLAGVADGVLSPDIAVHAVPFVDVDGVERGDQGKFRAPHDHNRDYVDANGVTRDLEPIYRSTAATMDYLRGLTATGDVPLALDFHCPYKWGGDNDRPFFVADADDHPETLAELADGLAAETAGTALTFDDSPGVGVHGFRGQSGLTHTFTRFATGVGVDLATAFEVPFVGTEEDVVTPESARRLGRHLAAATDRWLQHHQS